MPMPPAPGDEPRLPRRKTLKRRARMKRAQLRTCARPMKTATVPLSATERAAYDAATERARTPEGYLRCEACGRSLLDGQEERHHVNFRSHGGPTEESNLRVLCRRCHSGMHGIRLC
jgi:5-methylcytosine-specific restriction endonuclease McrA